jgi:peptidoglycan/LPS O-acetylase OafA/YrhL
MKDMKNRILYLDVLRCLAILLVIYCHFVSVGSSWQGVPFVIRHSAKMPLLAAGSLTYFDEFLTNYFSTDAGTLGVCLFFLMTGFLVPVMMERYNRLAFFINRVVRIFPVMWVCLAISGLFVSLTNDFHFSAKDYLHNMLLIKTTIGGGMRWMLPMEVIFYCFAVFIGKFNLKKVLVTLFGIIIFLSFIESMRMGLQQQSALHHLCFILEFIPIIFIGTSIYISKQYKSVLVKIILISFFTAIACINIRTLHKYFSCGYIISTYGNLGTYLVALALWYGVYLIFEVCKVRMGALEGIIRWLSQTGYPIYLLHLALGLTLIEKIRYIFTNTYLILALALIFALLVSRLVYLYVELPCIAAGKRLISFFEGKRVSKQP